MRVRFTLVDAAGVPTTYRLEADPAAPLAAVVDELAGRHPGLPRRLWCDGVPLDPAARLGDGVLRAGSVLRLAPPPPGTPSKVELAVIGGPDAGRRLPLSPAGLVIGRAAHDGLVVDDPTLPQRELVVRRVDAAVVEVQDEGAANPVVVEGQPADGPLRLALGTPFRMGTSLFVAHEPPATSVHLRGDGGGNQLVDRPFRLLEPAPQVALAYPTEPATREPNPFPIVAALLPPIGAVAIALITGHWQYLLFAMLSPLMVVGNAVSDRRRRKRSGVQNARSHAAALAQFHAEAAAAARADAARRRDALPDPGTLARVAERRLVRLWERRVGNDDFLSLRVGLADLPAAVTVEGPHRAQLPAVTAHDSPVSVPLAQVGVVGIAGDPETGRAVARALVLQLATLHAPSDVRLVLLTVNDLAHELSWSWARFLPHLTDPASGQATICIDDSQTEQVLSGLARLISDRQSLVARRPGGDRVPVTPAVVLVVDGTVRLRTLPALTTVLRDGPAAGVYAICLDERPELLPAHCAAVVELETAVSRPVTADVRQDGTSTVSCVVVDQVATDICDTAARALAPLVPGGEDGSATLPTSVRLLELVGLDPPRPETVRALWRHHGRTMKAPLGVSSEGILEIDIAAKGPHLLVAGTTGAGKSELLKTLVASLALRNPPSALSFVLVDYKGGSAFADCARLPHTIGLVTDLDGHLVERALTSLRAELKRREHELARVGASSISDYWALLDAEPTLKPTDQPPLARLMLVIDEFAMLAQELPDFMKGLVEIARVGRTLGIHLVLATQRPSGVVSPEIRANATLRIALRVASPGDSSDVIERPDAAAIAEAHRGRAFVQAGQEFFVAFQSAQIGGPRPEAAGEIPPQLTRETWALAGGPWRSPAAAAVDPRQTDLRALVDSTIEAAAAAGEARMPAAWLPPLPELVTAAVLPHPDVGVAIGLEDRPGDQTQVAAVYHPADGHLALAGSARSGRSSALRILAAQLAGAFTPAECHLYGLDCGSGGLAGLDGLPHTGAVVTRLETDRGVRLVGRLAEELTRRAALLGADGYGSVAEQWAAVPEADRMPYLVLLVDRWEGFIDLYRDLDGGDVERTLLRLLSDGPAVGLSVVIAGDKSVLATKLASLIPTRWVLRFADRDDVLLAGLRPKNLPEHIPAGRAFRSDSGGEIQLALLAENPTGPAQLAALTALGTELTARHAATEPERRPFRLDVIPAGLTWAAAARYGDSPTGPGVWSRLGVGGDTLEPQWLDLANLGGLVVLGSPRRGRTTALRSLGLSAAEAGADLVLIQPRGVTWSHPHVAYAGTGDDAAALTELFEDHPRPLVVLVDDAEAFAGDPAVLKAVLAARRTDRAVVAATTADDARSAIRGFLPDLLRARTGLLLSPQVPLDGSPFGVSLPRSLLFDGPPGRALYLTGGRAMVIQIPLPPHEEAATDATAA